MSQAKWVITNGVKFPNDNDDNDEIYHAEIQNEEDVAKTTVNTIYFRDYIVTKSDGEISFKRRKLK